MGENQIMKPDLFLTEENRTVSVLKSDYEANAMDEMMPLRGRVVNTHDISGLPSHLNATLPPEIQYVVQTEGKIFRIAEYFMTLDSAKEFKKSLDVYYETVPEGTKPIRSKKKRHYKKWFNKHKVSKVFNNATISKITKGDDNNGSNNGTVELTLS